MYSKSHRSQIDCNKITPKAQLRPESTPGQNPNSGGLQLDSLTPHPCSAVLPTCQHWYNLESGGTIQISAPLISFLGRAHASVVGPQFVIERIVGFYFKKSRTVFLFSFRQLTVRRKYKISNQSISQSINQSVSQSVSQSINQSINQSISQSVSQSISQSVSQSINQLIIGLLKAVKPQPSSTLHNIKHKMLSRS